MAWARTLAAVRNLSSDAGGGVLRDSDGKMVWDFVIKFGSCSVVEAELRSILHGLSLAWSRGIHSLIIESDSYEAISLLSGTTPSSSNPLTPWVVKIRDTIDAPCEIQWRHVYREANLAAHKMAQLSLEISASSRLIFSSFATLDAVLEDDISGSYNLGL